MGIWTWWSAGRSVGIGHQSREEFLNDLGGAFVFFFHSGRVVKVGIEIALGGGAVGFHGGTERGDSAGRAANVVERGGTQSGHATPDFFDQIGDQRIQHAVEGFVDSLLGVRRQGIARSLRRGSGGRAGRAAQTPATVRMPESRPSSKSAVR